MTQFNSIYYLNLIYCLILNLIGTIINVNLFRKNGNADNWNFSRVQLFVIILQIFLFFVFNFLDKSAINSTKFNFFFQTIFVKWIQKNLSRVQLSPISKIFVELAFFSKILIKMWQNQGSADAVTRLPGYHGNRPVNRKNLIFGNRW